MGCIQPTANNLSTPDKTTSSLVPDCHPKKHAETKENETDSNLFKTNEMACNKEHGNNIIDNCQCLQRLSYALKYHTDQEKVEKDWIHFCAHIYTHQMLDDYSHLLSTHYHQVE
eukprot:541242_1